MNWFDTFFKPVLDTVTAIGTLVALVALIITVARNRSDDEAGKQQEYLEQCKRTLEWAYNSLEVDQVNKVTPASRLNWLTAARHILAYQELRKKITLPVPLRVCEDFEEFWRHQFYLALSDGAMSQYSYWSQPGYVGENIHIASALVVIDFSGWPEGKQDPTDTLDIDALKARNGLKGNAGRGLRSYIDFLDAKAAERERLTKSQAAMKKGS
ncbi:MAG: hypothetical protein EOO28_13440 [Comamonadaceae bacterium]|nr:MAG: hypothetical protein EOO28_13440 [Comamonadaceae bacterium]